VGGGRQKATLPGLSLVCNAGASGGARRRIKRRRKLETHLMKTTMKSRRTSTKKPARTPTQKIPAPASAPRPGGKLGLIVDKLAAKHGVTADELVKATGWQRHSVLGALSKLRSRGFHFDLDVNADRKAYRLSARNG